MTKPIFLLGEAMGANEAKIGKGFVGSSGIELLKMLHESKIIELSSEDFGYISKYYNSGDPNMLDCVWGLHPEVHRSNVFQLHPSGNDLATLCGPKTDAIPGYPALLKSKFVRAEFQPHLERLADELLSTDPNLVVCFGNTALWALTGKTGVTKLRGTTSISTHCVEGYKLLSTYHPAAVLRQWDLRPVTVIDLIKAKRESAYAELRRPPREIWIEPSLEDISRFFRESIDRTQVLSVDIETSGRQVTCIGFSPRPSLALVVPFFDKRKPRRCYWETGKLELSCWGLLRQVLEDSTIPKVFQNGLYDIAFLWRSVGIGVKGAMEDTMLAQHALQPEALKGLGFLGSIYTDQDAWKSARKHVETIKRDE